MKKAPPLRIEQKQELELAVKKSKKEGVRTKAGVILLLYHTLDESVMKSVTGYSLRRAMDLRKEYLKNGIEVLFPKERGIRRLLKKEELKQIEKDLLKTPKELKIRDSEFWTTGLLASYIYEKYEVKYKSKTSYYVLFKKAKLSFHKPGKVYKGKDELETEEWIKTNRKQIQKALNDPSTIILCEDEMILSTMTTFQKIWLPTGEYPLIEVSNQRKNRSMYGFLNIKEGREHVFSTERQNMYETRKMLRKIRKLYPTSHILLLWDNVGWHKGSIAQSFIQNDGNIDQIYFPKYSPELNPQEHVWREGRAQVTHNRFIENVYNTGIEFVKYLNSHIFNYSLLRLDANL